MATTTTTTATMSMNLIGAFRGLSLSSSSSSPFITGDSGSIYIGNGFSSVSFPPLLVKYHPLTIESAHKKGAGSTKNGRDSKGQRLGVKIYGDQLAKPGAIIIRQRGTKFHPGKNVGLGKDHTIFSLIDGLVKFEKFGPEHKKKVSVYPHVKQPMNPNSCRARKIEFFRMQRERLKARKEGKIESFGMQLERRKARKEGYVVPQPELVLASVEEEDTENNPDC